MESEPRGDLAIETNKIRSMVSHLSPCKVTKRNELTCFLLILFGTFVNLP